MITIFNRKELFITYSMEKQAELRSTLAKNGIDYKIKTVNFNGNTFGAGSRAHTGSFAVDQTYAYEYIFYVKRADYEKAKNLVR
ncbi:MAG: hypothetical protein MJ120_05225 [Clostridia bacterium]|nr:hypothetical protein [Clostridia bacterium]